MSEIFERLTAQAEQFKVLLDKYAEDTNDEHEFGWENRVYSNHYIRRAHLDIIDLRDTKKIYMMHLCIFPTLTSNSPIFGVDIVAGPNKVTGAFLDYSPVSPDNHPLSRWFGEETKKYSWKRERELPEWARAIFSKDMVAASNINTITELDAFLKLAHDSLVCYLINVKYSSSEDFYLEQQNCYCKMQKQNPHTPRVLESLGFEKQLVVDFINLGLFPELPN